MLNLCYLVRMLFRPPIIRVDADIVAEDATDT